MSIFDVTAKIIMPGFSAVPLHFLGQQTTCIQIIGRVSVLSVLIDEMEHGLHPKRWRRGLLVRTEKGIGQIPAFKSPVGLVSCPYWD